MKRRVFVFTYVFFCVPFVSHGEIDGFFGSTGHLSIQEAIEEANSSSEGVRVFYHETTGNASQKRSAIIQTKDGKFRVAPFGSSASGVPQLKEGEHLVALHTTVPGDGRFGVTTADYRLSKDTGVDIIAYDPKTNRTLLFGRQGPREDDYGYSEILTVPDNNSIVPGQTRLEIRKLDKMEIPYDSRDVRISDLVGQGASQVVTITEGPEDAALAVPKWETTSEIVPPSIEERQIQQLLSKETVKTIADLLETGEEIVEIREDMREERRERKAREQAERERKAAEEERLLQQQLDAQRRKAQSEQKKSKSSGAEVARRPTPTTQQNRPAGTKPATETGTEPTDTGSQTSTTPPAQTTVRIDFTPLDNCTSILNSSRNLIGSLAASMVEVAMSNGEKAYSKLKSQIASLPEGDQKKQLEQTLEAKYAAFKAAKSYYE